jgi:5'-3' exonuclease
VHTRSPTPTAKPRGSFVFFVFFFFFFRAQIGFFFFALNSSWVSHLQGMFYRTIRLISNGIKPVYVFDGKPPTLKSGELAKRYEKRGMQNSFASPL